MTKKKYGLSARQKLDNIVKALPVTESFKKSIFSLIDEIENDAWERGGDAAVMDD
jgi:hypothetical protein